jgi:hypothetical protein
MKLLKTFKWHDGSDVPIGYVVTYTTATKCPTCGHDTSTIQTGVIKEIRDLEDGGFAEVGSTLQLVLDDETIISGDTENGFGQLYAACPQG